jgi:hypothetical protein
MCRFIDKNICGCSARRGFMGSYVKVRTRACLVAGQLYSTLT